MFRFENKCDPHPSQILKLVPLISAIQSHANYQDTMKLSIFSIAQWCLLASALPQNGDGSLTEGQWRAGGPDDCRSKGGRNPFEP